ncbi:MAG: hypothetical protein RBS39_03210 [Phycisphaerales bacterium]|jgi:hypothetical protein|nr:hypothetical protein [Phycisphaerales bacterium]
MDQRQTQIREGAGLEESRLNTDFIDALRKWSTPVLLVITLGAAGMVVKQRLDKAHRERVNEAFAAFDLAGGEAVANPSPDSLKAVAEQYSDVGAVAHMARLRAADVLLDAVRRGVVPGAVIDPITGGVSDDKDLLDDARRTAVLGDARALYERVAQDTLGKPGMAVHQIGAQFGIAAVAECLGDLGAARASYEKAEGVAKETGNPFLATLARERIDSMGDIEQAPRIYAAASLPQEPEGLTGPNGGQMMRIGPGGTMTPITGNEDTIPPLLRAPEPAPGEPAGEGSSQDAGNDASADEPSDAGEAAPDSGEPGEGASEPE